MVSDQLTMTCDRITITGSGMGVTEFWQGATGKFVFRRAGTETQLSYCCFKDFSILGTWEMLKTQGLDADRPIAVFKYARFRMSNVEVRYSRQMSLTLGNANEVVVDGCRVFNSGRDAINVAQCNRCIVVNNVVRGCYDDAIAVHTNTAYGNPPHEGHVISHNLVEDSFGIKALGAVKTKIAGNTVIRPKGYGIYVGQITVEGDNDLQDIVIASNTISDVINSNKFGGGTQRDGIYVSASSTSFVAPVVGDPSTPVFSKPDVLSYLSNSVGAQNAGGQRLLIHGNVVAQTLPPVAAYSSWGFGTAFTANDTNTDPDLSSGFDKSTIAVNINGAVLNMEISGNVLENVAAGIQLSSTIVFMGSLLIAGNQVRRYATYAVTMESSSVLRARARIIGNMIDGDPYFEASTRLGTPVNGTWNTGSQLPGGVNSTNWETVDIRENSFRNVNQVLHSDADSRVVWGGNVYFMQPNSSYNLYGGSSTNNRGIRVPHGLDDTSSRLVWEDSDPTSTTYGQVVGHQGTNSGSALPTTGHFVAGQFFRHTNVTESGSAASKYTIVGWQRLTTGGSHVLNTDWRELRGLTGN